jgi:putative oxidoreductase
MMSARNPNLVYGDTDDVIGHSRAHALDHGSSFLQRVVSTDATLHPTLARLTLGLVMLPHALQKTLGWFGGSGFSATYEGFVQNGIPGPLAFLAIVGELVGALSLIFGVLTRVGAAIIMAIMLGAIALVHLPNGFFMNWEGAPRGEGFEFHLLAIGLALVCLLAGGGKASVDRGLMKWRPAEGGGVSPALTS